MKMVVDRGADVTISRCWQAEKEASNLVENTRATIIFFCGPSTLCRAWCLFWFLMMGRSALLS